MYCVFLPRRLRISTGLMLLFVVAQTVAQDKPRLTDSLIFHAGFDGNTDVNLFARDGDGWAYTADSTAMKHLKQGNDISSVTIAKGAGRIGDAVRFGAKTKQVLCYKAATNGFEPTDNWSGTVSVWLKLDPDKDLPAGFCDPVQITAKKWNDAAFFIDFDSDVPRDFRLGVFSDHDAWNPKNIKWDEFPVSERPMITVKQAPFSGESWTHVVFTFVNVNSTSAEPSIAALYLNGQQQGSLTRPIRFTWPKSDAKEAMIMLGINYVGDMDELAIFRRALSSDEVKQLYLHPEKL